MTLPRVASVTAILTRSSASEPGTAAPEAEARRAAYVVSRAETAECTCPAFCERDHGNE